MPDSNRPWVSYILQCCKSSSEKDNEEEELLERINIDWISKISNLEQATTMEEIKGIFSGDALYNAVITILTSESTTESNKEAMDFLTLLETKIKSGYFSEDILQIIANCFEVKHWNCSVIDYGISDDDTFEKLVNIIAKMPKGSILSILKLTGSSTTRRDVLCRLLNPNPEIIDIEKRNAIMDTVFQLAIANDDSELVGFLLTYSNDFDLLKDIKPLDTAISEKRLKVAQVLLDRYEVNVWANIATLEKIAKTGSLVLLNTFLNTNFDKLAIEAFKKRDILSKFLNNTSNSDEAYDAVVAIYDYNNINFEDLINDEVIFVAIDKKFYRCAEYLVEKGRSSYKEWLSESVLKAICKNKESCKCLASLLDLTVPSSNEVNQGAKVKFDFGILAGRKKVEEGEQMKFLHQLTYLSSSTEESGTVFVHPVTRIFINYKWSIYLKIRMIIGIFYFLSFFWTSVYTTQCIGTARCLSNDTSNFCNWIIIRCTDVVCKYNYTNYLNRLTEIFLLVGIIFYIVSDFHATCYGRQPPFFINKGTGTQKVITCLLFLFANLIVTLSLVFPNLWQGFFTIVGILIAWRRILWIVPNLPARYMLKFGWQKSILLDYELWIHMFDRVVCKSLAVLFSFSSLLLGFSAVLMISFPNGTQLQSFPISFARTFVALVGELEFVDLFNKKHNQMAYLAIFLFVFFVMIVILNMLIGLTVQDFTQFQREARRAEVRRSIQQLYEIEKFLYAKKHKKSSNNLYTALSNHSYSQKSFKYATDIPLGKLDDDLRESLLKKASEIEEKNERRAEKEKLRQLSKTVQKLQKEQQNKDFPIRPRMTQEIATVLLSDPEFVKFIENKKRASLSFLTSIEDIEEVENIQENMDFISNVLDKWIIAMKWSATFVELTSTLKAARQKTTADLLQKGRNAIHDLL